MATIFDLEARLQNRLEESTDGVGTFWSVQGELRPFLAEAMCEATLITGEPQVRSSVIYTIPASTSFTVGLAMPSDALALLRVEGAGGLAVDKVWISDLDRHYPGWETAVGNVPRFWFPFGLTQFGIYPNLTAEAQVVLNYVAMPVTAAYPYTGAEPVPFQSEYHDAFDDYGSHVARLKEGTTEFDQSFSQYNNFLSKMQELSRFAYRKNSLRFSQTGGAASAINDVRQR